MSHNHGNKPKCIYSIFAAQWNCSIRPAICDIVDYLCNLSVPPLRRDLQYVFGWAVCGTRVALSDTRCLLHYNGRMRIFGRRYTSGHQISAAAVSTYVQSWYRDYGYEWAARPSSVKPRRLSLFWVAKAITSLSKEIITRHKACLFNHHSSKQQACTEPDIPDRIYVHDCTNADFVLRRPVWQTFSGQDDFISYLQINLLGTMCSGKMGENKAAKWKARRPVTYSTCSPWTKRLSSTNGLPSVRLERYYSLINGGATHYRKGSDSLGQ